MSTAPGCRLVKCRARVYCRLLCWKSCASPDSGVIEDTTLPLTAGMNVITGETGAGKTMVVTGLGLLFGGRADAGRVRAEPGRAVVEGRLRLPARSRDRGAARVIDAGARARRRRQRCC